jgi:hypothetical protein
MVIELLLTDLIGKNRAGDPNLPPLLSQSGIGFAPQKAISVAFYAERQKP